MIFTEIDQRIGRIMTNRRISDGRFWWLPVTD